MKELKNVKDHKVMNERKNWRIEECEGSWSNE